VLPEVGRHRVHLGQAVTPESFEPRAMARLDELFVELELHQRVAPVEKYGAQHGR
jgi:hypothetical protein